MVTTKKAKSVAAEVPPPADGMSNLLANILKEGGCEYDALNDFVLVAPQEAKPSTIIEESEHWKQNPNWAIVIAVGEGRLVNGILTPIALAPGDRIYITKYGEDVELVPGLKTQLVHASECKLRRRRK